MSVAQCAQHALWLPFHHLEQGPCGAMRFALTLLPLAIAGNTDPKQGRHLVLREFEARSDRAHIHGLHHNSVNFRPSFSTLRMREGFGHCCDKIFAELRHDIFLFACVLIASANAATVERCSCVMSERSFLA